MTKGAPTICVKLSLCVTSHTAAEIPFSVAALSSGFSDPCSGSRICIPYKCSGRPLPTFSPDGFLGVSHIRAESRAPHCSLERSGAGHLFYICGTTYNALPSTIGKSKCEFQKNQNVNFRYFQKNQNVKKNI